jgi:hypothetical protein
MTADAGKESRRPTASALNSSHASLISANSASSWAMRLSAAASSSASTLGVPSMTPASISAWRFHRNKVA